MDEIADEIVAAAQLERDAWREYEDWYDPEPLPTLTCGGIGVNYIVRAGRVIFQ